MSAQEIFQQIYDCVIIFIGNLAPWFALVFGTLILVAFVRGVLKRAV